MNDYAKKGIPVIVKEFERRYFFGMVIINYHVEDRRPDLDDGTYNGKYKHFLTIKLPKESISWEFRTNYPLAMREEKTK